MTSRMVTHARACECYTVRVKGHQRFYHTFGADRKRTTVGVVPYLSRRTPAVRFFTTTFNTKD